MTNNHHCVTMPASVASTGAGEIVRNQELLAKLAALEEKAANDAKTIVDLNAEKAADAKTIADLNAEKPADAKTITNLIAEKEAATKTIAKRDETIKTLTADKAALLADTAALTADKAELRADIKALLANNIALLTINTTNAAANERNSKSHQRVFHLVRYFKNGFIRESHMRHKSDGRHGADCGKRVKKLQE